MRSPRNVGTLITALSVGFVLLGWALPVVYGTPLLRPYASAVIEWLSPGARELDLGSQTVLPLGLGILGGSIAGKWTLHAGLAYFGIRRGQRWAYRASVLGLLAWFVVDSTASLVAGAIFNVLLINLLPLLLVGGLLFSLDRGALQDTSPPEAAPVSLAFAGAGVVAGFATAFLSGTILFQPWWDATGEELLGEPMAGLPQRLVGFLLGPIGGCIVAHFSMIAFAVWRGAPERWVSLAVLTSLIVWFVYDSSFGVALGAYFNVLVVNVPSFLLMIPVFIVLDRRARQAAAVA